MELEKKECVHISGVLEQAKKALIKKDAYWLKDLSNQTVHSACNYQDSASITIAVLIYALSKLIEREDYEKIEDWNDLVKNFISSLDLAIDSLNKNRQEEYQKNVEESRRILTSHAINLKPYIEDVLKKASINKGSKIYEHGISLALTSKLLGVTQWELSEYVGQKNIDFRQAETISVKERAKMALEFFS